MKMNYGTTKSTDGDEARSGNLLESGNDGDASSSSSILGYSNLKVWLLDSRLEVIMLVSVILNGLATGIMFIFSNTVMPALATVDSEIGIEVMNTINVIIVNPLFLIAFFGGLVSAYPALVMWKNPDLYSPPASYCAVASTLIFFFGNFMVTGTQNVPRNNALLAVDPESEEGATYWQINFLKGWVAWNTARCIFAGISAVLGALSLCFMRKPPVAA